MTKISCFSRDELKRYLLGELPEPAWGEVASHVETCESCEATVVALDRESDTLIESLRQGVPVEKPASVYRLAAQRAISHWQTSASDADHQDASQPPTDARRLRDYELIEPLARGGMGTVYRARHLRLNRHVALKVLPGRLLQNAAVVARFEREMQAVGSLQHPAIVQATDGGEVDGVHFLVMELIDGCDAGALVQTLGPLPAADACEIARQAAIGMAYVHQQGIIHRDLKPSNLMVTRAGDVKVLDLGLARVVGEQLAENELTTIGQLMGTLDFMAPEQIENSHEVDQRTDIYALGATLYKLLAGRAPHSTDATEPFLSKVRRIASEPLAPLRLRQPDADEELCELVDRMLSNNAGERPASMNEVAELLQTFCASSDLAKQVKETVARREKPDRASAAVAPLSQFIQNSGVALPQGSKIRPVRGQRVLGWIAACLFLAAAAMGIVITLQTTAGQLVIETATPDVEVRVLKAGQPYRQLTVKQQAESLRLGAGEYEIEIISGADGLEIENGSFTLKRGQTWLARIVHRQAVGEAAAMPAPMMDSMSAMMGTGMMPGAASQAPTYESKTLAQWLALLQRERSAKQLYEACKALDKLATGDETPEAVAALLVAIRVHNAQSRYQKEGDNTYSIGDPYSIWDTVRLLLASREQGAVVPVLIDELDRQDVANVEFILHYLLQHHVSVRPFVTDQLLSHIERLTADDKPQVRKQAISVLRVLAPEETAVRRLVAALSDREVEVRLLAANLLIEMHSNTPPVVSALRQVVAAGVLRHRAEAAWMLGDLGPPAAPAIPELTAIVRDDDIAISRSAVLQTPHTGPPGGGMVSLGMASVKDAAIRAMGEIGDESVVPDLIEEWRRRAIGDGSPGKSAPIWNNVPGQLVANTYSADWVADAIELLSEMRPTRLRLNQNEFGTGWKVDDRFIEDIYRLAFAGRHTDGLPEIRKAAEMLIARAHEIELKGSREVIAGVIRVPNAAELALEIELIKLLATVDDPRQVLEAMFVRWSRYEELKDKFREPSEYFQAIDAYRQCAVEVLISAQDWQTKLVPHLLQLTYESRRPTNDLVATAQQSPQFGKVRNERLPAAVVLMEVLDQLGDRQQVEVVARTLQLIAVQGGGTFADSIERLTTWLDDTAHRAALQEHLEQATSDAWEHIVAGLLRAGLADDEIKQALKTRFGNDSINRSDMLKKLIQSLDDRPDLAQVIIHLIEHPALDAPARVIVVGEERTETSLRAVYLKPLLEVPAQHRAAFMPLLQKLVQSGKNGESDEARRVLDAWK